MTISIKNLSFFLILVSGIVNYTFGQNRYVDSLLNVLKYLNTITPENSYSGKDTNKIKVYHSLGIYYTNSSDFDNAILYFKKAKVLCEKSITLYKDGKEKIFKKFLALSLDRLARNLTAQGHYVQALDESFRALKINNELGNKRANASIHQNLGVIFRSQGELEKSLDQFKENLKIGMETKDKRLIATSYSQIGNIYSLEFKYDEALSFHFKALKIAEETNYNSMIASCHGNIGIIYEKQSKFIEAENQFLEVLSMFEKLNDKKNIAECYYQLGNIYVQQIAVTPKNKIEDLVEKGEKYLNAAVLLGQEIKSKEILQNSHMVLSDIENMSGNYQKALKNYKLFSKYRDELLNEENTRKSVKAEMHYEFDKKVAQSKLEQEIKDDAAKRETDKHIAVRNMFVIAFGFMFLLSIFIFRSYRQKQKANRIISTQKKDLETQKEIVDQKQKQIIDSINYAQRIQSSILPEESLLKSELPESFIIYLPRDIVSGDFYWFHKLKDEMIIVAADCTGHGVPGAFLSMVGSTLLDEIVTHNNVTEPGDIIKNLSENLSSTLSKNENSTDGMDISICRINYITGELSFAGANHTLYFVNEHGLQKIESQINSINGIFDIDKNQKIEALHQKLESGTVVYMTTDGYIDQLGGEKNKKFLSTRFEKLLSEIYSFPLSEQKNKLKVNFTEWKKDNKQIDDLLVIGFRFQKS